MFIACRTFTSPSGFSTLPVRSERISRVVWPWKPITSLAEAFTSFTDVCGTKVASICPVFRADTAAVSLVMTFTTSFSYG
jgi:hypothetical protein